MNEKRKDNIIEPQNKDDKFYNYQNTGDKKSNKKTIIIIILSVLAFPFVCALIFFIVAFIYMQTSNYKNLFYEKSKSLYKNCIKLDSQNEIKFIVGSEIGSQLIENYSLNDSTNLTLWLIKDKSIHIKRSLSKYLNDTTSIQTANEFYQPMFSSYQPTLVFSAKKRTKFQNNLILKYSGDVDIATESKNDNYNMFTAYIGKFALASSDQKNDIVIECVQERARVNLAVFYRRGKILVVIATAKYGYLPIKKDYLREVINPRLFEKGL